MLVRSMHGVLCCAVVASLSVGGVSAWAADGSTNPGVPINLSARDSGIQDALREDATFDFQETPLREAVDFLTEMHRIGIQLDNKALDEAGIETDIPVTRDLKNVSLGSALNLMLRDHGLAYIIRDDVVLVTTQDVAKRTSVIRFYDVSSLLKDGEDAEGVVSILSKVLDTPAKETTAKGAESVKGTKPKLDAPQRIAFFKQKLIVRGPQNLQHEVQKILQGLSDVKAPVRDPRRVSKLPSDSKSKKEPPQVRAPKKPLARDEHDPFKSGGDDPFGVGGEDDPFAPGGNNAADPFGGGEKPAPGGRDPFGG